MNLQANDRGETPRSALNDNPIPTLASIDAN